ncbi:hypothetical protein ACJJTC_004484 [Scirpophaga incertulas]
MAGEEHTNIKREIVITKHPANMPAESSAHVTTHAGAKREVSQNKSRDMFVKFVPLGIYINASLISRNRPKTHTVDNKTKQKVQAPIHEWSKVENVNMSVYHRGVKATRRRGVTARAGRRRARDEHMRVAVSARSSRPRGSTPGNGLT